MVKDKTVKVSEQDEDLCTSDVLGGAISETDKVFGKPDREEEDKKKYDFRLFHMEDNVNYIL